MKSLIDVIIPVYNTEKYVKEAIYSVLNQTLSPDKLIIIDDGSTDKTRQTIKSLKSKKVKIVYKFQKNGGVSSARNHGLKLSHNKYVAFLDADDLWEKEKLEKQLKVFEKSNISNLGVVYCNCDHVDEGGKTLAIKNIKLGKNICGNILNVLLESNKIAGSASAVLIRREAFTKVGNFDETLSPVADWDMWIRISQKYSFDYVDEKLVRIRHHPNSMSYGKLNMLRPALQLCEKHIKSGLMKKIPSDVRYYYVYSFFEGAGFSLPTTLNLLMHQDIVGMIRTTFGVIWDICFAERRIPGIIYTALGKIVETYYRFIYTLTPAKQVDLKSVSPDSLVVISVAFNNPEAIFEQLKSLRQNLLDDFCFVLADNSLDSKYRIKFKTLANKLQLTYIPVPLILGPKLNPSFRHGLALNWLLKNFIIKNNIIKFGFIENDVFLIKKINISQKLGKYPFYGPITETNGSYYLLPYCSFFNLNEIQACTLNFLPSKELDTGGRNYQTLFSKYNMRQILNVYPENVNLQENIKLNKFTAEKISNLSQYFDGWVHLRSGSGWRKELQ